jgi:type VI secretion system protein ImpF
MPELSSRVQLQPSLLDRLTDDRTVQFICLLQEEQLDRWNLSVPEVLDQVRKRTGHLLEGSLDEDKPGQIIFEPKDSSVTLKTLRELPLDSKEGATRLRLGDLAEIFRRTTDRKKTAAGDRAMSVSRLRQAVLRDLGWLFNAHNLASLQDLEEFPQVAHSVVNFGIRDLSGYAASGVDLSEIEQMLRQAILDFEPRILPNSVVVRAIRLADESHHNLVVFSIEGDLWAQPTPIKMRIKTELDLETGAVNVVSAGSERAA